MFNFYFSFFGVSKHLRNAFLFSKYRYSSEVFLVFFLVLIFFVLKEFLSHTFSTDTRSRLQKRRTALINQANRTNQPLLSDFFDVEVINKIDEVIQENEEIKEALNSTEVLSLLDHEKGNKKNMKLLHSLIKSANCNNSLVPTRRRYEDSLKKLGCILYLLAGRMAYEILYANLESALPSLTTVRRLMDDETQLFKAGVLRTQELKEWLIKRDLELRVCVAEDQTKIVESIQYNSKENVLDGLSLPLDCNGFPLENPFSAKNAYEIKKAIDNGEVAAYVNVFMVQPQHIQKTPAFCLISN